MHRTQKHRITHGIKSYVLRLPLAIQASGKCGHDKTVCTIVYMVVDLKVLVSSVHDDDPEHIKISFGESFSSSWRKYFFYIFFLAKDLAKD